MRLYLYGAILLAVIGTFAWVYHAGRDAAETEIDNQNKDAENAAIKAKSNASDCFDAGGKWVFQSGRPGECVQPD